MKKNIMICLLILFYTSQLLANDRSMFFDFGKKHDAQIFVYQENDSLSINIFARISNSSFNYKKTNQGGESSYIAEKIIEVLILDGENIIKKRISKTLRDTADRYQSTISKSIFKKFFLSHKLLGSTYKIKINFDKSKRIKKENHSLKARAITFEIDEDNGAADLFFVNSSGDGTYSPTLIKSGYDFSSTNTIMLIPILVQDEIGEISISEKVDPDIDWEDGKYWYSKKKRVDAVDYNLERINRDVSGGIIFEKADTGLAVFTFDMSKFQLEPGVYTFDYKLNGKQTSKVFYVEWESQALALANFDLAISSMKPVLSDAEYEAMTSSDDKTNIDKFYTYWKNKDPSPNTSFNEALYQYFSRVDYSFFNYSTIFEKNGAKTDRGKIYTLYGPPDKIINKRNGKNLSESWYYKKRGERLVFSVTSNGVYKLESIENI